MPKELRKLLEQHEAEPDAVPRPRRERDQKCLQGLQGELHTGLRQYAKANHGPVQAAHRAAELHAADHYTADRKTHEANQDSATVAR